MTYRSFIATVLAISIAVTGLTAAPARANEDDTAKLLAGITALAIIGAAIAHKKKKDKRKEAARNDNHYDNDTHYYDRPYNNDWRYDDGDRYRPGPPPKRVRGKKKLPGYCRVNAQTRRGEVRGFGRRCLQNNFAHFNSLPRQCEMRARGRNGDYRRIIYNARCLNKHGYRVARRH